MDNSNKMNQPVTSKLSAMEERPQAFVSGRNSLLVRKNPRTVFIALVLFLSALYVMLDLLFFISRANHIQGQIIGQYQPYKTFYNIYPGFHIRVTMPDGAEKDFNIQSAAVPRFLLPQTGQSVDVLYSSDLANARIDSFPQLWFDPLVFLFFASGCLFFAVYPYLKKDSPGKRRYSIFP